MKISQYRQVTRYRFNDDEYDYNNMAEFEHSVFKLFYLQPLNIIPHNNNKFQWRLKRTLKHKLTTLTDNLRLNNSMLIVTDMRKNKYNELLLELQIYVTLKQKPDTNFISRCNDILKTTIIEKLFDE